ncbi:MAG TPA: TMEM43 family protein [Dokdonella sp.]|uniref:TMEM43 family protein n=1 Tax=Dokdonella sp. TaxID=2291710 RepID=UPI0025C5E353|nr:TMEM43 family protein [Dokdonella sp.]MBX3691933.1 hypothetical protein [Dokdonella sp.]MCW5568175.1 hypothetical protein [Dokdonella sp.]HNR91870.1 TMEM43 family protein [Dokdonella sp.]
MATRSPRFLAATLAVLALVAAGLAWWSQDDRLTRGGASSTQPLTATDDRIDPANEGRLVRVEGRLGVEGVAIDTELGISSDAALMLREVEMYQWHERCLADACTHSVAWSSEPVDSARFTEPAGHLNPTPFPLLAARFSAPTLRLGAFRVAPDLLVALPSVPRPVSAAELAPNLAASFRDVEGVLFSGDDPANPAVGDLRVRYHIVATGPVTLTGVQRGEWLTPAAGTD